MDKAMVFKKMPISFINYQGIDEEKIPKKVLFILRRLEAAGFLSFLVGGCVRDLICRKDGKDWDIVTDARPEQTQHIFYDYKALFIGKSFQTITLIMDSAVYHISSLRNERKSNTTSTQEERYHLFICDLLDRDFTINSLAWHPEKGLLDPAQGLPDLERKVLRSINPDLRFQEDPLRMLRAIRIACELNFTIDDKTKNSIKQHAFLIHRVSPERIREELSSILKNSAADRGVRLVRHYGLERHIFSLDKLKRELVTIPDRKQTPLSGFNKIRDDLAAGLALWGRLYFSSCLKARLFFLPLTHNLRFKNRILKKLKILLSREWDEMDYSTGENIRLLMAELGRENCRTMFYLKKIWLFSKAESVKLNKLVREEELLHSELQKNPPISLTDLAIGGEDLIKIGIPPGKRIGEILQILLNNILLSPQNNRKDYLLEQAIAIQEQFLQVKK
ncbi:MAG TPA: hypothetical protein PK111_07050 [Atribacterota bacterium]|nr:hypothetical protein [Atribacterota bacterium]